MRKLELELDDDDDRIAVFSSTSPRPERPPERNDRGPWARGRCQAKGLLQDRRGLGVLERGGAEPGRVDEVVEDRGDEHVVGEPGRAGDLGDHAGLMHGGERFDLEDHLVVTLVQEQVDAGRAVGQTERRGGVSREIVDPVATAAGQLWRADHRADLPGVGGVALDLHRAEDPTVEEDHLDLPAGDRSFEQPAAAGLMMLVGRQGDARRVVEKAHTGAEAAASGLEDRRPAEQAESAAVQGVRAVEGEGRGDGEGVKTEDLAGPQLVVGEGGGRRRGPREGDPAHAEEALERPAAAGRPVGGKEAGGDPGGPEGQVEVVVGDQNGHRVAEAPQGSDKILATLCVDLAIITRGGGLAARGRVATQGRCSHQDAEVVRAHDVGPLADRAPAEQIFGLFPSPPPTASSRTAPPPRPFRAGLARPTQ